MFPFITKAYALSQTDFGASDQLGAVSNFYNFFVLAFNYCVYFGGFFASFGLLWAFASMAYKSIMQQDVEAAKLFSGGITKALMFAVIGVLLLGMGSIFKFVGDFVGAPVELKLPTELNFAIWN